MASAMPMPTTTDDDEPLDLIDLGQLNPVYDDEPLDLGW